MDKGVAKKKTKPDFAPATEDAPADEDNLDIPLMLEEGVSEFTE